VRYLLNVANRTIPSAQVDESHIVGSWAGLRPLIAPAPGTTVGNASREHRVETGPGRMITVTGGKLTSNRVMAKHVVDVAMRQLGRTSSYRAHRMPISGADKAGLELARRRLDSTDVPIGIRDRWFGHYGTNALKILARWQADEDARRVIAPRQVTVAEVRYCVEEEYCATLDDLMVRRTSLFFWDKRGGLEGVEAIADVLAASLSWSDAERTAQIERYTGLVRRHRPPFPTSDHDAAHERGEKGA
jgi:glycerol-3-phosphate dehydrogenase